MEEHKTYHDRYFELLEKYEEQSQMSEEYEELKNKYNEQVINSSKRITTMQEDYNNLYDDFIRLKENYSHLIDVYTRCDDNDNDNDNGDDYNDNDYDYNNDYDEVPNEFSNVERPEHYNSYPIETIEAIAGQSTSEEFEGWLKGNIIKYVSRYKFKNGSEDLSKAHFYIKVLEDWNKGYELRSILDEIEEGEY